MNVNHSIITNKIEEEMNNPLKREVEKQPAKKISNQFGNVIVNLFVKDHFYKKSNAIEIVF